VVRLNGHVGLYRWLDSSAGLLAFRVAESHPVSSK